MREVSREKMPRTRNSVTYSFSVGGTEGYMHVGLYEDHSPGEIFIVVAKQGSTLAGIMDAFAIAVSMGLQYGVPLKAFVKKFVNMKFEPHGSTNDEDVANADSIMDYLFRRLGKDFLTAEDQTWAGMGPLAIA